MSSKELRVRQLLEQGLQSHRAGDLNAAEQAYAKAAALDPRNPDAANLRGVVALVTGRLSSAVTLFRKATTLQPGNPGFWGNLGNALFTAGHHDESASAYRRASQLAPENPDFDIGIATSLAAAGELEEANRLLLAVVKRRPDCANAWFNLGKLSQDAGDRRRALDAYQRALQIAPQYADGHLNLGVVQQSLFQLAESENSYRQALAYGAPREATLTNLLSVLTAQGKFDVSEALAHEAMAEFPRSAVFPGLLAAAHVQRGRLDAALAPAMRAAELDPGNTGFLLSLGGIQYEAGAPEQGLALLKKVRDAHPDDIKLAYRIGIALLTAGEFEEGWRHFAQREVRLSMLQTLPWLSTQLPEDLPRHRVRLLREQGLGDELFFLRYVPMLKTLGARIAYIANPKLLSILARTDYFDELVAEPRGDTPEQPALSIDSTGKTIDMLIGDLPHAFYRAFREPCRALPPPLALSASTEKIEAARAKLSTLGPPPYLALTWRAGTAPDEQKSKWWLLHKHIPLQHLGKTLAGLPHTLLAVQRKPLAGEVDALATAAGAPIHDLCDINDDLEAMLGLLAVVDEYVGVSNTNMHLRAGLGRSARVLVTRPVEWRWMAYGDRSPWFPDFSVYRQGTDGTWQIALDRVRTDLLAASRGDNPG